MHQYQENSSLNFQGLQPSTQGFDLSLGKPKQIQGTFRKCELPVPSCLQHATGIQIFGRTIKTFVFSCDPYIIRNTDADAVLALAPFTCQPAITRALIQLSERPVFCGVAGSITSGKRSVDLAHEVEMQGAQGIVASVRADTSTISQIAHQVDIPLIVSICQMNLLEKERIEAGASIVNVAAGKQTPEVVRCVRHHFPNLPIIATCGKDPQSALATIHAGADATSWTPPSLVEIEKAVMNQNRTCTKTA